AWVRARQGPTPPSLQVVGRSVPGPARGVEDVAEGPGAGGDAVHREPVEGLAAGGVVLVDLALAAREPAFVHQARRLARPPLDLVEVLLGHPVRGWQHILRSG